MAAHRNSLAAYCILLLLLAPAFAHGCIPCGTEPASPPPPPPEATYCPRDTLKLGVCADVLGLVGVVVGTPASSKCCPLLDGLVDLEAAVCLCLAIKANVLGLIKLEVPVALSLILSACGKKIPDGFKCA
ncbi:hypothetical protein ACLOJK_013031 [Asimina triloba]